MSEDEKIEPTILYNEESVKKDTTAIPMDLGRQQQKKKMAGSTKALIACVAVFATCAVTLAVVLAFVLSNTGSEAVFGSDLNIKGETPSGNTSIDLPKQVISDMDSSKIMPASPESGNIADRVRGNVKSSVTVIEYADMQCPGCAGVMFYMDDLYEKYGDRVAFIYRHYPITGHVNARSAAIAVEAAGEQGFFWEMLSEVFLRRSDWISLSGSALDDEFTDIFEDVAGGSADLAKYAIDLKNSNIAKKVDNDKSSGMNDFKVNATPTIIVNGEKVDFGGGTLTEVEKGIAKAIEAALNK